MLSAFLFAALSAGAIYLACEAFTNGVEWLGRALKLGQTATGTVLAALATGLPEGIVTLVATAFGHNDAERSIGVGAALAGPLALSTIAYGVTGLTIAWQDKRRAGPPFVESAAGIGQLRNTQVWFLAVFVAGLALGSVQFPGKSWIGLGLIGLYGLYVIQEMRAEADAHADNMEPLLIRRQDDSPALAWILVQVAGAVAVTFAASQVFVGQLATIADGLHLSPQLTALFLSPIATELPETMNAVIWCRQGRERLALANIGGAMMVQATIPAAFGLLFTPWLFDRSLRAAALVTLLAALVLFRHLKRGKLTARQLMPLGLLYLIFVAVIVGLKAW